MSPFWFSTRSWRMVAWLFLVGIMLFSGSLYLLVLTDQSKLGAVTPFGGLSLIAGWTWLAIAAWTGRRSLASLTLGTDLGKKMAGQKDDINQELD